MNWVDTITKYLSSISAATASGIGGVKGKIVGLILKYIALPLLTKLLKNQNDKIEAKKILNKLKEVLNDASKNNDEIIAADDDFFNRN